MKSLKLSITLIALFTTSICIGQEHTVFLGEPGTEKDQKGELVLVEKAYAQDKQIAEKSEQQAQLDADYIIQLKAAKNAGADGIDDKISQLIADGALSTDWETESTSPLPSSAIPQLVTAYESNAEGIEEKIAKHIKDGNLSIDVLNANNVDRNSKLYKKLNDHQKIGK